jgi:hypothetical protein
VDAPVQGLNYRTSRSSGVTDSSGQFDFWVPGEEVVFSIGSLEIGRARATGEVHVYELFNTQYEAAAGRNARVAQVLQSLDANKGAGQTIVLDPAVTSRLRADTSLDWTGSQEAFDTNLKGLLDTLGMGNQFVSNAVARVQADAYLAAALMRCPLELPQPPAEPMTPAQYKIVAGKLSCMDLARINFYRARVMPMLEDQITAGMNRAALVEDSFGEKALQDALDVNPLLTALDSLDALADFKEAAEKKATVEAVTRMSQALLGFAKTAVQAWVVFDPPVPGQTDPAKDPQVWMGLTNDVLEVVANGSACVAYWRREAGAESSRCAEAIGNALKAASTARDLPGLKLKSDLDQRVLTTALDTLASAFSSISAVQELMDAAGEPKDQIGKAAFGLATAVLQTARDGVSLVYAVDGLPDPNTGWQAVALGVVDRAMLPVLELGSKCYGGVAGTDVVTCATSIARESGKAITSWEFAVFGTFEAVRHAGVQNEALVAKSLIEEVLWAGEAGRSALLEKYFPGETWRTYANSSRDLATRVGLVKHDLRAVMSYEEWRRVLWGAVFTGQSSFNVLEALNLASTYLQMIQANTLPNFNSPSIDIASQPGAAGDVQVRVVVAPGKSGIAGGALRCSATGSLNYAPASPFKGLVNGVTPLDFSVRFDSPGRKGMVCALYTSGVVPRFVGSRSAVLESVMPAAPTVARLQVSPAVPSVGDIITLTAEGRNLVGSGFRFSNFPPCNTQGAVAPGTVSDTSMTFSCKAVSAMRLSFVGVVDSQGVPLAGIGQPLTVCPTNAVARDGACLSIPPSVMSPTFVATVPARLELTFTEPMDPTYFTTGDYIPSSSVWESSTKFVITFTSYTPGGKITLKAPTMTDSRGFRSTSGVGLATDYVFQFPITQPPVGNAPAVTNLNFVATAAARLEVTFSQPMNPIYFTTGDYIPSSSVWESSTKFVITFSSYVPDGTITLKANGFASAAGAPMASDVTYRFPTNGSALLARWSFDDCTGADSTGSGRNAVLKGGPTCVAGRAGNALRFSGLDVLDNVLPQWLELPKHPGPAVSFATWFKWEPTTGYQSSGGNESIWAIGDTQSDTNSTGIWISKSFLFAYGTNEPAAIAVPGTWMHVAFTSDGKVSKLYVNGEYVHKVVHASPLNFTGQPQFISSFERQGFPTTRQVFSGLIDDARLYGRVLSDDEVRSIYLGN